MTRPLVLVPCCVKTVQDSPFHAAGQKYLTAVTDGAGARPLLLPALGDAMDVADLVQQVDGLLLTGSMSMVDPQHYDGAAPDPGTLLDPERDATTLPLIRAAVAARLPLLAICRGQQELNVALGGTLHQKIQELPGRIDHRAPVGQPREIKFAHAHEVALIPGGRLRQIFGRDHFPVNSLHWQGVDRPAPGLAVEALAPDGQIEGVRITAYDASPVHSADGFGIGVQWHPEWHFAEDPPSLALFRAFAAALAARRDRRLGRRPADQAA